MSQLFIPVGQEDHVQGSPSATCTLVEYGDYECPSCGQIEPVIRKLQKLLGKRLRFVFRNFPLSEIHPWAEPAAEAAEFAAQHGKFWEMHDLLYENQAELGDDLLLACADRLGLPRAEIRSAIVSKIHGEKIQRDFTGGVRSGVNGTPTLFLNGRRYNGSFDIDSLTDAIGRSSG